MKNLCSYFLISVIFCLLQSNVLLAQEDTIPPIINILSPVPVPIVVVPCDGDYTEFGAEAYDEVDGFVPVTIGGDCICETYSGSYFVTYTAEDASGNSSIEARLVIVQGSCNIWCEPYWECDHHYIISPQVTKAQDDFIETNSNQPITIPVLANDEGKNLIVNSIVSEPKSGTAMIIDNKWIEYQPNNNFVGVDTMLYEIKSSHNIPDYGLITQEDTALVIIEVGTTSIEANPTYPSLQIFPNPAKDLLTIEVGTDLAAKRNVELLIFNTVGQLKVIYPVSNVGTSKVNIEGLQKGLYIFQLKAKGEVLANGKVLVE
ncbi:MAG: T9SS type A sorting domain-containing protein [Chitinophagales bacterium]